MLATAAIFTIAAGFNDGGNLLAAAASSRTIPVPVAYVLVIACTFAGPAIVGTAVARTIGTGIADFHAIGFAPLVAGIAGATIAVGLSYAARVPTSMSV
ncbi:MAG TPA: inorganic phosphate transporter, partial [Candidatus Eremiobacteraceae bacterium]|nr:inorganic phosphate transporter [Candidatus Eremiobacteraceae bacterium]